jgi:hypothetical protein
VGTKKTETAASDQQEDDRAGNGERDRAHETEQPKFDIAYRWIEMFHRVSPRRHSDDGRTKNIMICVKVK